MSRPEFNPSSDITKEREPDRTPAIAFERYFPEKVIDTVELLQEHIPTNADPKKRVDPRRYIQDKYGPPSLHEADPNAEPIVSELAISLLTTTKVKPDIVIAIASHLPKDKEKQRLANTVRADLANMELIDRVEATPLNTHTFTTACSGSLVALDWIFQHQEEFWGANVLLVDDETGYRRTLPPVNTDLSRSRGIFNDGAFGMQFILGEDLIIQSSEVIRVQEGEKPLLSMVTAEVDENDPFITVMRPPFAPVFNMMGPDLLKFFNEQLLANPDTNLENFVKKSGFAYDDFTFFLSHQASSRMVKVFNEWARKNFPKLKDGFGYVGEGIYTYGNTSSASDLLDLQDGIESGKIQKGDIGLLVAYGAGLTSAKTIIQVL